MRLGTISVDAGTAAAVFAWVDGVDCVATVAGYGDAGAVLRAGARGLAAAREATGEGDFRPYSFQALRKPVLEPGSIICAGINFRAHLEEMGRELPEHPTLFAKLPRALTDPPAVVELPAISDAVDYEGEVVAVIGRRCRSVEPEEADSYIAGYTLMNDISMRDYQYRTLQWFAGKNFERSTPVGPWIVTADEIAPEKLELTVTVNGEQRQRGTIGDLIFSPAHLLADISWFLTLEPGDLIATGTPGGVGYAQEPKRLLADGDVVAVEVPEIGRLETTFRSPE
jgi:acylpyruvate hydrolase